MTNLAAKNTICYFSKTGKHIIEKIFNNSGKNRLTKDKGNKIKWVVFLKERHARAAFERIKAANLPDTFAYFLPNEAPCSSARVVVNCNITQALSHLHKFGPIATYSYNKSTAISQIHFFRMDSCRKAIAASMMEIIPISVRLCVEKADVDKLMRVPKGCIFVKKSIDFCRKFGKVKSFSKVGPYLNVCYEDSTNAGKCMAACSCDDIMFTPMRNMITNDGIKQLIIESQQKITQNEAIKNEENNGTDATNKKSDADDAANEENTSDTAETEDVDSEQNQFSTFNDEVVQKEERKPIKDKKQKRFGKLAKCPFWIFVIPFATSVAAGLISKYFL